MTILLVDDDHAMLRSLSRGLRALGWGTLSASGPEEARGLIDLCDVVITDWDMPDGGGREVFLTCRDNDKPCIVHTGSPVGLVAAVLGGYPGVMAKPTPTKELSAAALELVRSHVAQDGMAV
jgi:DNA-binding response OmpR family regulator